LLGISVPWISNIISVAELSPMPRLDLTPLAFTVAGVMFAWGLFRFRLLDLVPVARDLVIETMTDGLIVLDARDRVVDVNPPIANVIGLPAQKIIGQPVDQVFARWCDLVNAFRDVSST
jgi:PAS domain-containing protein